ncbi:MAG: TetR/AcrR family transcriptional regulator [Bacteroidia bacterium]|nr:TetR/AcrR family transcriptional regulator [Bacteroidia bacterium]
MQYLKEESQKQILMAGEQLFLEQGFYSTSMREIADLSGVGVSNIYNYFQGKDEIFSVIVQPVINKLNQLLQKHHGDAGPDILTLKSGKYTRQVIQEYVLLLQKHGGLLELLFFRAQGSSLEGFKDEFVRHSTLLVKTYFHRMKERYPQLHTDISDFSIHLHTVWMFTLFEELILNKVKTKDFEQIIEEYITFETTGWRELMKI